MSGYCYQVNTDSLSISWKSKKQRIVALSSCEAEYVSLTYAIQEGKFLQQLLADMTGTCENLLICLLTIKVPLNLLESQCIIKGQNILTSDIIIYMVKFKMVVLICLIFHQVKIKQICVQNL